MPPEKRSRRGCKQCRLGHHKCDEALPSCGRCRTRGVTCEYTSRIRWGIVATGSSESRKRAPGIVPQDVPHYNMLGATFLEVQTHLNPQLSLTCMPSPVFKQPEEIMAYTYYVDTLAGELQAQDGLHNPYRRLSVLAIGFPVLLHTILSCAAEHMHISGHCHVQLAITQNERAIRSIRAGLGEWKKTSQSARNSNPASSRELRAISSDQALLAAILLQPAVIAFNGTAGSSAQIHMDMAFYLLNELDYLDSPAMTRESFISRALIQRFAIVDLALSVYHRRRPRLSLNSWFAQSSESNVLDETQPAFREMTGCPHAAFTYLLRAMHLAADLASVRRPPKDVYSDAIALETEIRVYNLSEPGIPTTEELEKSKQSSHINSALRRAWSYAALLLVLRRVLAELSESPRVQHAISAIFSALDAVPVSSGSNGISGVRSGVDSACGLPFYLAAREAMTEEDQNWIRQKHSAWRKVYPNPARVQMMEVAERIWRARAEGSASAERTCEEVEKSCATYIF